MRRVEVDLNASPPHPKLDAAKWARWEARAKKATREVRDWIDAVTAPPLPGPAHAGASTAAPPPATPPELDDKIWGDLKALIIDAVFLGRCAFCELDAVVGGFGDAEHYRPKRGVDGRDPNGVAFRPFELSKAKYGGYIWLVYDWLNLVPACSRCNNHKANRFWVKNAHCVVPTKGSETTAELNTSEKPLLLHPYFDSPRAHLEFGEAGVVAARGKSERGQATIDICDLNRAPLRAARERAQKYAWARVEGVIRATPKGVPEAIMDLVAQCDAGEEPFSSAVSDYLTMRLDEHIAAVRKDLTASEALRKKLTPEDP